MTKLKNLVGEDETIRQIFAYKTPLNDLQLTNFVLYHMFIVFKTDKFWWSIEKNHEEIIIQRSWSEPQVKDYLDESRRTGSTKLIEKDLSIMTIHKLLRWLYLESKVLKRYSVLTSNCKHFAISVFNYLTMEKCIR